VPGKGPGLHPSGARGPRLKSLDLPLCVCIYIRTYILTVVACTCSCAEPVWPLSCRPVLSCPILSLRLTPRSLLPPPVPPVQYLTLSLHCNRTTHTAPHYIALCCTVARLHSPCVLPCTIALPPTRASFSVANTPTARKRYRVHRARSCPLSRISDHLPTNPARRRASK